jgi:hypothetical protein
MPPTTSTPIASARLRLCSAPGARRTPVLRERDELEVEVGLDALLHVEQRLDREQARVRGVDVRADREHALRHGEVAIRERAPGDRLLRQRRLELAPQRDALEQRAARVDARHPVGERRVDVEMRVDERRRHHEAARVERLRGVRVELRADRGDAAAVAQDVDAGPPVGQRGVANQ